MTIMTRLTTGPGLRVLLPMAVSVGILFALRDTLAGISSDNILGHAADARPWQWSSSLLATGLCFYSFSRTERAVHRWVGSDRDPHAAGTTAMAALGVTQATGLGPLVGLLVRWRCDRQGGLARAATVTALSSLAFLTALATLASLAVLTLGTGLRYAAWGCLASVGCFALLSIFSRLRALPGLPILGALALWGMLDAGFACLAFWAFLPDLALSQVAPAFLMSLGAGLASGLPGGLGSFDVALIQLLPQVDPAALIGAAVAFRMVHFALPACLALAALVLRPGLFRGAPHLRLLSRTARPHRTRHAEAGLIHQDGALALMRRDTPLATCWTARHTLVQLGASFGDDMAPDALRDAARSIGKLALVYKVRSRHAATLRQAGWTLRHTGTEALVNCATFAPSARAYRQLRRKLRSADANGVTIAPQHPGDLADLSPLDRAWQTQHGAARGVSMGRFDPAYMAHQLVLVAKVGGTPVAFVTLHRADAEWTLDIMRWGGDAPDGTMQALVAAAIEMAQRAGIADVSLAAVPELGRFGGDAASGLRRFKQMFAPRWVRVYAAAPSRTALAVGLADLVFDITHPPDHRALAHHHHEPSAFARVRVS